jgi:hypothetical protein
MGEIPLRDSISATFRRLHTFKRKNMEELFLDLETQWMTAWKKQRCCNSKEKYFLMDFTLTSSLSSGGLVDKEDWVAKLYPFGQPLIAD